MSDAALFPRTKLEPVDRARVNKIIAFLRHLRTAPKSSINYKELDETSEILDRLFEEQNLNRATLKSADFMLRLFIEQGKFNKDNPEISALLEVINVALYT